MSQNISDNIQGKASKKKALGVAFDIGVLWGVRMGIISSLIICLALFWSSGIGGSLGFKSMLFFVLTSGWLVIPGLGGAFAAKRTGRGAGIGAYCGLFLGPFTALVTAIGTLIEIFACAMLINYGVIPESWAIAFSGGGNSNGIGDLAIALPFVAIGAFIASFGVGPLLGGLGGEAYRDFANRRQK